MLLLCAATSLEIAPALEWIRHNQPKNVEVLITGIGVMETTYSLCRQLNQKKYDLLVQGGIAGSLHPSIKTGAVYWVSHESLGDLGVKEQDQFIPVFNLNLADPNSPPWKEGKLQNAHTQLNQRDLPVTGSVTVNEITTDPARIAYYRDHLDAGVEAMEGAAFHYVALKEGIPFVQLRAVSNYAGERDKKKWEMQKAIDALNAELIHFIQSSTCS